MKADGIEENEETQEILSSKSKITSSLSQISILERRFFFG